MTVKSPEIPKSYGIGIDTGGTYTDSVIVEFATGAVIGKAKALTTPDYLGIGIENSLLQLDRSLFARVGLVALSTTLATNSVVEGKGARVGLILAVPNPSTFTVPESLPADAVTVIAGAHNHRGEMTVPLDSQAEAAILRMVGEVDAFAVSSYFSIYNSEHETGLRDHITRLTGKPAVCAHELSGAVGMVERATTAALNARLLPIIHELLAAVEKILDKLRITAPLMVVKGDGSMMSHEACRSRPVETVLSGPAASIAGACRLSGLDHGLVVDMGGTTTDIAMVRDSRAAVAAEGARIGGWRTRVQAVDMWTLGLGGDSHIRLDEFGKVRVGPRRVVPLCQASATFPELPAMLARLAVLPRKEIRHEDLRWFTPRKRPSGSLSLYEDRLLASLEHRVMSLGEIRRDISSYLDIDNLLQRGVLIEVGFTPTDLLHCNGSYTLWNRAASLAGLRLFAGQAGLTPAEMEQAILRELDLALALAIVAKALQEEQGIDATWSDRSDHLQPFLAKLLGLGRRHAVAAGFTLQVPLIAVGAPAHAHLPAVAERLSCRLIIPPHAEVANAYGAISGKIVESATALIRPATPDGYLVISHNLRQCTVQLQEAARLARDHAATEAIRLVEARGGVDVSVEFFEDKVSAPLEAGWGDSVLIELRVIATASGSPALDRLPTHSLAIPEDYIAVK